MKRMLRYDCAYSRQIWGPSAAATLDAGGVSQRQDIKICRHRDDDGPTGTEIKSGPATVKDQGIAMAALCRALHAWERTVCRKAEHHEFAEGTRE